MTTADALLAAVIASPDDDLPRLVYADWLDENGDPDRAEFIRLQVAREKELLPTGIHTREKVLLDVYAERWLSPLRQPGQPLGTQKCHAEFRRGFVERVWMTPPRFVQHAEQLFTLAPVNELRVILDDWFEVTWMSRFEPLSRLKTLDVCDPRFGPASGGEIIARNRYLAGLRLLRLTGCNLDDTAAAALCDSQLSLELLDLRHNPLTEKACTRLRNRFGDAVVFE